MSEREMKDDLEAYRGEAWGGWRPFDQIDLDALAATLIRLGWRKL